ncbi:MAG: hypothetical protein S4CHLAM7_09250 [Chlamydiae bacterium]|nr:hypothetical protein [Chlamydiota bacterium]
MLNVLFSNSSIERILLFLFVNEKGYGSQIQSLLKIPLTPIQNALKKLEEGGVIESYFQGNKKVFKLNTSYPLFQELESLLKKTYTLLSASDKKRYCFFHKPQLSIRNEIQRDNSQQKLLESFWKRLQKTTCLDFTARLQGFGKEDKKRGKAAVELEHSNEYQIIFREQGFWYVGDLPETAFSNCFRWTLDIKKSLVSLEHLRYGVSKPTFLFHLAPTGPKALSSVDAHLCRDDTYIGTLTWSSKEVSFDWRVIGPRKNQFLSYRYC